MDNPWLDDYDFWGHGPRKPRPAKETKPKTRMAKLKQKQKNFETWVRKNPASYSLIKCAATGAGGAIVFIGAQIGEAWDALQTLLDTFGLF